jgi:hypothetical protein
MKTVFDFIEDQLPVVQINIFGKEERTLFKLFPFIEIKIVKPETP